MCVVIVIGIVSAKSAVMKLLCVFLVLLLFNFCCDLAIKFRLPFFKFPVEKEYMKLFRYSTLLTFVDEIVVICENIPINDDTKNCNDEIGLIFPCHGNECIQKGDDSYCKVFAFTDTKVLCRDGAGSSSLLLINFALESEFSGICKSSCETNADDYLLFTYYAVNDTHGCSPLSSCNGVHDKEDVVPLVYYVDGNFEPATHCSILSMPVVDIPPVVIFSDATISPGIPFEIYLVDKLNEGKKLLRYFEFVELPTDSKLYFEINSVELVTCYLYTDDSFVGFFAVSKLNPTISLEVVRNNYGICAVEMLCEGRLNASHSSIVAYTRNTFVILESPVLWEYAVYKRQQRAWKRLTLLRCDDVLFDVLKWYTDNLDVELEIWDLTEGKMLSNSTNKNRVWFKSANSLYAAKVTARYRRCNPYIRMEHSFEIPFSFKELEFLPQFANDSAEQEQLLRDCPSQRFNKPDSYHNFFIVSWITRNTTELSRDYPALAHAHVFTVSLKDNQVYVYRFIVYIAFCSMEPDVKQLRRKIWCRVYSWFGNIIFAASLMRYDQIVPVTLMLNLASFTTIKFRLPFFKFPVEKEYMKLFRYSTLLTFVDEIVVICENIPINDDTKNCNDEIGLIFPCHGNECIQKGDDSYCKVFAFTDTKVLCRDGAGSSSLLLINFALESEFSAICKSSCETNADDYLLFTYYAVNDTHGCSPLSSCNGVHDKEDVVPLVYYVDGNFEPATHCSILSMPVVDIPPVVIFADATISPGIPFEIYLVDKLNEGKKLLRYFEFVELPTDSKLYFEINSVELVTCYLYTDDSFVGFFAVSKLNPTISLEVVRNNYGICAVEMLCEGRLNASHSSIVAYTRNTFVILESPVLWEYAVYKRQQRAWKRLTLLRCDDVLFDVLKWYTDNLDVELEIWDLTEGKMLSNSANSLYAAKVTARYRRCNPYIRMEHSFEIPFSFKECPGDVSIASFSLQSEEDSSNAVSLMAF
ncbi:hypothetical protein T4E_3045 [Trichinella pseudospiralis]|uniref:Uncharacterized protein n=1 Tax=Trichinella pseudospiralis TaxID=6337 RepID=A0A0V0YEP9_TRIPS|nr:hypothetical protein T4E_3045 [Trichinella pseudospiralis]